MRLLLVDNSPRDVLRLREILKRQRSITIDVSHAESVCQAERHLEERPVDVVLLDLALPDEQGFGAIRRVREVAPSVPLVVLTNLDDESLAARSLHEGAQDCLLKAQIEKRGLLRALVLAIERKAMDEALFVERERAEVTLNCIADAVASTNASGEITFLNAVAEQLTGWTCREATGRLIGDVFRILDPRTRRVVGNPIELAADKRLPAHLATTAILVRRDGGEIPIEDSVASIKDRAGKATGAVVVFRDVSVARALALQMTHTAAHDVLTGLPNRLLVNDRISQAIALGARNTKNAAVLFLDLDGFKQINDTLGHRVGDSVLQSIAKTLVKCLRNSDTVSRLGGDEFVALLSEIEHPEDAAITARRMLQAVSDLHVVDGHELRLTTSIGVSVYPDDGLDADTLVKNADTAMFRAKHSGRHGYQFFDPAMTLRAAERQFIEEGSRHATERNELALH
jgi:diguanylate cyclase (GGDEF)-like protein/PAS domain S-box-containing protein